MRLLSVWGLLLWFGRRWSTSGSCIRNLIPSEVLLSDGVTFKWWVLLGMIVHSYTPRSSEVKVEELGV
jgi:hypothetical protein